jgi:ankyrin repeat protein
MESTGQMCLKQGATINPPPLPTEGGAFTILGGRAIRICSRELLIISIAAANGYDGILKAFLDKGADPNVNVPGIGPSLSLANKRGHTSTFKLLLSHIHIDADSRITILSPLFYALEAGSLECVQALIKRGVNIWINRQTNLTVIQTAVKSGDILLVQYLVKHEFSQEDNLAFYLPKAVQINQLKRVKYLLLLRVNPNHPNPAGLTTLHQAISFSGSD